jgi:hypothetical protein
MCPVFFFPPHPRRWKREFDKKRKEKQKIVLCGRWFTVNPLERSLKECRKKKKKKKKKKKEKGREKEAKKGSWFKSPV